MYVSDANGRLSSNQARVLTDSNGDYKLPASLPFINPLTAKWSMVPIGSHITTKYTSYPDVISKIDFTNEDSVNVSMIPKTQSVQEMLVQANSSKTQCEKLGGKWDSSTKTCVMPKKPKEKTWWEKNKKIILIGGASLLLVSIIAIIVVTSSKKKN